MTTKPISAEEFYKRKYPRTLGICNVCSRPHYKGEHDLTYCIDWKPLIDSKFICVFAESFRSASQESQGRRLMHCPVDSPGVTHYEDEDCKEAGCVPVQESESRVKELEAMMKEVLQACLCDGDRQLKVRRRARAMLRLSGEPEKERA
jgi:hypothetical protein